MVDLGRNDIVKSNHVLFYSKIIGIFIELNIVPIKNVYSMIRLVLLIGFLFSYSRPYLYNEFISYLTYNIHEEREREQQFNGEYICL
ncbi:hypothetical protein AAZX31_05G066600 [Glycine max]